MVSKIAKKVYEKIERGEMLHVSMNYGKSHILDAVIPDAINMKDDCIYIEGEKLILNIDKEEEFEIFYNDMEEEFVIKQGKATYYLA